MAEDLPRAGTKRPHLTSFDDGIAHKKRRVRHSLQHVQTMPAEVEPAPQDPVFAQGQLLRSITAALAIAGFDSVQPSALESFRAHTEEYMMELISNTRVSMHQGRRTKPVAPDFSMALSLMPNAATASLLEPQLSLPIPDDICCPPVRAPVSYVPKEFSVPDFSGLLQPLAQQEKPGYIPSHFPAMPPRHAWTSTPVFSERERDARKMRERATEEGMMAEQALRKLATAAKAGALKAEQRRSTALRGHGKQRDGAKNKTQESQDAFADVLKDIGGFDGMQDVPMEGANDLAEGGIDVGMPEGVVVNYDMGHYRHGASRKALRL